MGKIFYKNESEFFVHKEYKNGIGFIAVFAGGFKNPLPGFFRGFVRPVRMVQHIRYSTDGNSGFAGDFLDRCHALLQIPVVFGIAFGPAIDKRIGGIGIGIAVDPGL